MKHSNATEQIGASIIIQNGERMDFHFNYKMHTSYLLTINPLVYILLIAVHKFLLLITIGCLLTIMVLYTSTLMKTTEDSFIHENLVVIH